MLTRLKVSGFKNLVDVDVRFGPFTCIAGPNGVGKSNLFDAIHFLSLLADRPLAEAAQAVRTSQGGTADIDSLFHRSGKNVAQEMSFAAEMIVPREGFDDFGQSVQARSTFLRYSLTLARSRKTALLDSPLEILSEELFGFPADDIRQHLPFLCSSEWQRSAIVQEDEQLPLISTKGTGDESFIVFHSSRKAQRSYEASRLPRTLIAAAAALGDPTILMASQEMRSWKLLHLEPSALREPDSFSAPTTLAPNGAHLASTLFRVANSYPDIDQEKVYGRLANHLADLIHDVRQVWVDEDTGRNLLTVMVEGRGETPYPARVLSDGTLRFLALAVLDLDPYAPPLLCVEEPENGMHPERISAILRLLQDIPTDVNQPVSLDNPLRQVIINTHSPAVVSQVPEDSLVVADPVDMAGPLGRFKGVYFGCLPGTWREAAGSRATAHGRLLSYLNPFTWDNPDPEITRVVDRDDIRRMLAQ